jgi:hypothetical protein
VAAVLDLDDLGDPVVVPLLGVGRTADGGRDGVVWSPSSETISRVRVRAVGVD